MNLDTTDYDDWLLARDFNLIRGPDNKNKQGGDLSEMNMFNELISDLDLAKTPFSAEVLPGVLWRLILLRSN